MNVFMAVFVQVNTFDISNQPSSAFVSVTDLFHFGQPMLTRTDPCCESARLLCLSSGLAKSYASQVEALAAAAAQLMNAWDLWSLSG
jgi:hypothetical protein